MFKQITLNHLKKHPEKVERFHGKKVSIWSGEHKAWWRAKGCGYTLGEIDENGDDGKGVYLFEDAWRRTHHCCPRKKICYLIVPNQDMELTQ